MSGEVPSVVPHVCSGITALLVLLYRIHNARACSSESRDFHGRFRHVSYVQDHLAFILRVFSLARNTPTRRPAFTPNAVEADHKGSVIIIA